MWVWASQETSDLHLTDNSHDSILMWTDRSVSFLLTSTRRRKMCRASSVLVVLTGSPQHGHVASSSAQKIKFTFFWDLRASWMKRFVWMVRTSPASSGVGITWPHVEAVLPRQLRDDAQVNLSSDQPWPNTWSLAQRLCRVSIQWNVAPAEQYEAYTYCHFIVFHSSRFQFAESREYQGSLILCLHRYDSVMTDRPAFNNQHQEEGGRPEEEMKPRRLLSALFILHFSSI